MAYKIIMRTKAIISLAHWEINGIRVIAVKKLNVENCVPANFSDKEIDVNTTTTVDIAISNVRIHNVSTGIGIIGPGSSTGSAQPEKILNHNTIIWNQFFLIPIMNTQNNHSE